VSRERLLLCRPQGGLNDMLSQIEASCQYAERFDRTVVVETDAPSTHHFWDRFDNYFVSRQPRLILDAADYRNEFDAMETQPRFLAGRVNSYRARFVDPALNYVDVETGRPVWFDLLRDYPEPLLVRHRSGSSPLSVFALARLRLQEGLVETLFERLRTIGPDYAAIHVRNTDYRSDFEAKVTQWARELDGPVFVATDNRASLEACRQMLGPERTHSFAALPDEAAGAPLHMTRGLKDRARLNADAILDLIMLALSREFRAIELKPNAFGAKYSGYALLAARLQGARPILGRLIDRASPGLPGLPWLAT
jgi:hypothetical protein